MRIVLDTNIFVSGIFWEGNYCSQIIEAWRTRQFILISSLSIIEELITILRTFKIQLDEEIILEWQRMIIENSLLVESVEKISVVKADPKDDKFIEAAISGDAQYIVSQDFHLLKIGEYQGVRIITPQEFLKLI